VLVEQVVAVVNANGMWFPGPDGSEPAVVLLRILGRIAERTAGCSIPTRENVALSGLELTA
jgi:hypothetical protein